MPRRLGNQNTTSQPQRVHGTRLHLLCFGSSSGRALIAKSSMKQDAALCVFAACSISLLSNNLNLVRQLSRSQTVSLPKPYCFNTVFFLCLSNVLWYGWKVLQLEWQFCARGSCAKVLCKSVFCVHCARITSLVMLLRNAKPTDSARRPSRSVEPQSRIEESLGEWDLNKAWQIFWRPTVSVGGGAGADFAAVRRGGTTARDSRWQ